ncbi:hypothetical protein [Tuwongella immobilis]|uniref:Uncharacterized protein n=1 Tax=Tuwongella immobilis TaxID=692036 RepID=A0A6C2YRE0_9BACT|nr:hypothetical protein [Tuwongella immobilis]VIP03927.1 unnamed protein product [Tuwongella immobilis]VTS05221.1 unnamed protein product [Tuwongella immobilis]
MNRRMLLAGLASVASLVGLINPVKADYPPVSNHPVAPAGYLPGTRIPAAATVPPGMVPNTVGQYPTATAGFVYTQPPARVPTFQQAGCTNCAPNFAPAPMVAPVPNYAHSYAAPTAYGACGPTCNTGCATTGCEKGCLEKLKDWLFYRPSKTCRYPMTPTSRQPEPWEYIHARASQAPLTGYADCSICRTKGLRGGACTTCGTPCGTPCGTVGCAAPGCGPVGAPMISLPGSYPQAMPAPMAQPAPAPMAQPLPQARFAPANPLPGMTIPAPLPVAQRSAYAPVNSANSAYATPNTIAPVGYPGVQVQPNYTQRTTYPTPVLNPAR